MHTEPKITWKHMCKLQLPYRTETKSFTVQQCFDLLLNLMECFIRFHLERKIHSQKVIYSAFIL